MAFVILSVIKALLTRLLFAVHCLLTIWRLVDVYDDARYWFALGALGLMFIEATITLIKRKGREWKWFCPSFFFYLTGVIPGIWFLELDRLDRSRRMVNGTTYELNITAEKLSPIQGFEIPVTLDADTWVNAIEQTMLLLLIVGRWMLPKGDITRDQLSQLLFVYIGMASDIMELYSLFQEPTVLNNHTISHIILGIWSLSLLQFCLVLTATKSRKPRVALDYTARTGRKVQTARSKHGCCGCCSKDACYNCCASEIWSVIIMVLLQDGPFLTIRLYVMVTYKLFSYNILFFTAKNALIIMLQFYRLFVVCLETNSARRNETAD